MAALTLTETEVYIDVFVNANIPVLFHDSASRFSCAFLLRIGFWIGLWTALLIALYSRATVGKNRIQSLI